MAGEESSRALSSGLAAKPGSALVHGGCSAIWPLIHSTSSPALCPPVTELGKVWVFGGAAVLPMSGPFNFSFWTFDQIL